MKKILFRGKICDIITTNSTSTTFTNPFTGTNKTLPTAELVFIKLL